VVPPLGGMVAGAVPLGGIVAGGTAAAAGSTSVTSSLFVPGPSSQCTPGIRVARTLRDDRRTGASAPAQGVARRCLMARGAA